MKKRVAVNKNIWGKRKKSKPGDQKSASVKDRWLFRTDCFNKECAAVGQKQTGRIRQMTDSRADFTESNY
jgi:hypothetical protein